MKTIARALFLSLSMFLTVAATGCVEPVDSAAVASEADAEAASRDELAPAVSDEVEAQVPPAPPPNLCRMQQHQTCVVGSVLINECCADYPQPNAGNKVGQMPCPADFPGAGFGHCDGPRPIVPPGGPGAPGGPGGPRAEQTREPA